MSGQAKPATCHPLDGLIPDDPLMAMAWADCLRWVLTEPSFVARFYQDTDVAWRAPTSTLERMIDEATGADAAVLRRFVVWFNENVWGTGTETDPAS